MSKTTSVLSVLLTLLVCLSLTACTLNAPPSAQNPQTPDADPADTAYITTTTSPVNIPVQDMCWSCGDHPVAGDSVYCFACKCMLCDRARKGNDYLYCSDHNCNDAYCTGQALDNSQYCVAHKCAEPNCRSERQQNSEYCYVHSR